MALTHQLTQRAALSVLLILSLVGTAPAQGRGGGSPTPLYEPMTLELDTDRDYREAATGSSDSADPNPWTHRRLDVYFDHPSLAEPFRVPGYFAGDGAGASEGCIWRAHFTPQLEGDWIWFAVFESGAFINAAPPTISGDPISLQVSSGEFTVGPVDPAAPGFRSRGIVLPDRGRRYFRYSEPSAGKFIVAGAGSPENFLGYAGFSGASDGQSANGSICCCRQNCFSDCARTTCQNTEDPAPGFLHRYSNHEGDWRPGDPDWSANGQPNQGRGIIGALNYLGDVRVNSLYFMLMNLGGDGKDTHPFLTNGGGADCPTSGSAFTPAHTLNYSIRRMDEWRTVFEHAGDRGIMLQMILAEQEACNIRWFGPHDSNGGPRSHMSVYRRLFLKQMVAEFGHFHGIRWNLCEENKASSFCQSGSSSCGTPATEKTPQFTAPELNQMGRWLRSWDVYGHPVGVHTAPNSLRIYEDLLALPLAPTWLTSTSLQIHGESGTGSEYEAFTQAAAALFEGANQLIPIVNDEQGSPVTGLSAETNPDAVFTSTADDRRRRVLYDVLLSGGHVSYYFGYYSEADGGGDLRCEDFRSRDQALRQMGFASELMKALSVWQMEDRDALLVGAASTALYGRPEVAATEDGTRIAVYYPALRTSSTSAVQTGSVDLREFPALNYTLIWVNPKTGAVVGRPVADTVLGGSIYPVPIPDVNGDGVPGNAITTETDLILLLLSRGLTPTTTE